MEPGSEARGSGPSRGVALPGDLLCLAVAHEIKNDLQAVGWLLALVARDGGTSVEARAWAARGTRIVESSAARLRAVSGALIEEAHATVTDAKERVRAVVERAVFAVNLREARGDPRRAVSVRGDGGEATTDRPFLLEIAVTNLLTNAVMATPAGADGPRLTLAGGGGGAWAVVIEDQGPGLPEEARRLLAGEAGALAEVDFTRASARWGIGLLLVRAAAVAAGWEVRAEARTPVGSKVTLGSRGER